ncbi:MAG: DUF1232 domain-containing protein [Chloroflexia bacterium]|nr:DUF1232 domain-containing protein [Chloroflexia bacterium]
MTENKPRPRPGVEQVVDLIDRRLPFPLGSVLLALVSAGYLTNPTAGLIELIPDNLPFVGNLDEATAGILLAWSVGNLGRWWSYKRVQRRAPKEEKEDV